MTGARISAFASYLPGDRRPLTEVDPGPGLEKRLANLGQAFTHIAEGQSSTDLMVEAAGRLVAGHPDAKAGIGQVISAPSLLSGYGFDIPAIAVSAALGLENAECLNIAQGCVGVLKALDLARARVLQSPEGGDVLVVAGCVASTLTDNMSHGVYYWGDGAVAMLVTAEPGTGFHIESYAEVSSIEDWGAMRVPFGDAPNAAGWSAPDDLRITVDFPDAVAIERYIAGEHRRFTDVVEKLAASCGLDSGDVDALALPSFGENRLRALFQSLPVLRDRVVTDFRYGHMGGVDPLLFLERQRADGAIADGAWVMALTAAFTAQWAGLLLRNVEPRDA